MKVNSGRVQVYSGARRTSVKAEIKNKQFFTVQDERGKICFREGEFVVHRLDCDSKYFNFFLLFSICSVVVEL